MDQWTSEPTPPNPDANAQAGEPTEPIAASPEAGYEQSVEPELPEGDEMSEPAGGPFTGHPQPIGHPDVEEGDTSPETVSQESHGETSGETSGAEAAEQPRTEASGLRIEIELAEGNLTIVGGAEHVTVSAPDWSPQFDAIEYDYGMRFNHLPDDTELRAPDGATIIVREVEGDLRCERLDGEIRVNRAQGDTRIEDVAVARLSWIAGDLTADHVGDFVAEGIGGDAWLANIQRPATLGRIGGDLESRRSRGITITESVGGDVEIERSDFVTFEGPAGGDIELRRIQGSARLTSMGGDLRVNDIGEVSAGSIGGDLEMVGVAGRATIDTIGGDVEMTNTFGLVSIGVVGGDLRVERAPGGISVARTGGDALVDTLLRPEGKYVINAGGDITLRVRGDVNARFVAQSFGGEIRTRLPLTVERGRRRNLVGALGTGSATVTLQSGGDITIVAADGQRGDYRMSDEFDNQGASGDQGPDSRAHTFEGAVAGRKFRVRVENAPGRAGFQFKGPYTEADEERAREFRFDWERGRGAHASGEYGEQLNDLREQAETLARRAGEEARKYAEMATKRARETDWEAVGSEIRTTIERAMADLEEAFGRVRRDWDTRGPGSSTGEPSGRPSNGGAQRVRIEHDEPQAGAYGSYGAAEPSAQPQDRDALRRQTLEDLRNGRITLDDAERRLNDLR
ncbi:MAG TPA: hypothetical protein VF812_00350 [Ktedonobacterales bacterium]